MAILREGGFRFVLLLTGIGGRSELLIGGEVQRLESGYTVPLIITQGINRMYIINLILET